ncbi:MAG TPA: VIT1/CCC1 transporter family protein [Chryseolinea sp.]|nr:VIT1/CCC1 transporter family protein [Chryseolinea sp.]HPM29086.1 VIT1/CCC1 transporter family protein [Chryseolinea sp.]
MSDQNFWKQRVKESAVLSPVDRISEVLFGLIMVLSFTGAITVGTDGREEIRELLWAALGCNVAWGLVDAIMYLMNVAVERGRAITVLKRVVQLKDAQSIRALLKEEMKPALSAIVTNEELDALGNRLKKLPEPSKRFLLTITDFMSGVQIFFLVFLCTLPVALPFAFFDKISLAMRTSNGVALLMLFIGGYVLAGYAGFRRFITAAAYTLIGVLLVALTMALGG